MTICAQIAGATSFCDMHSYATEKRKARFVRSGQYPSVQRPATSKTGRWLLNTVPLEHSGRRPAIFMEWVDETCELADGDGIPIDGKCLRRAVTKLGKQPVALRAKRPVSQRSAASIQRNWLLNAERCAAGTLRPKADGMHRHDRRRGMPEEDRAEDRRQARRLPHLAQGEPVDGRRALREAVSIPASSDQQPAKLTAGR